MLRAPYIFFAVAFFLWVGGCSSLSQRPDEITGNNTGGVIPAKMAAKQDAQSLANAHCQKWGGTARITFPSQQTGGEVVFVCDVPGQAPPPQPAPEQSVPDQPQPKTKTKTKPK